ncbi:uncharacterized protein [Hetaerina americana]|uniref:uncharacterized protein n=1 Tax=Hetaerina americana TaxID=62018 RepID=UPI003A7F2D7F
MKVPSDGQYGGDGDTIKGTSYKFSDIKPLTKKIASVLTKLGFKKGDVLFFVTYDAALIFLIHIGVWLCGGTMRGSFQKEQKDIYVKQMREVSSRFILCDAETSSTVKLAASELSWAVKILSIGGKVQEALSMENMISNEDFSAFPKDLKINPKEDVLVVVNTSGSTGTCKGVMQTHFSRVAYFSSLGLPKKLDSVTGSSMLSIMGNYLTGGFSIAMACLLSGVSFYSIPKFTQKSLIENIQKYKPDTVFIFPYVINGVLQSSEIDKYDFSFMKYIMTGGSVVNFTTAKALETKLPHLKLIQRYGMSEAQTLTISNPDEQHKIKNHEFEGEVAGVKYKNIHGGTHLTSGHLLPLVEAKVVDPESGSSVGRNVPGHLLIKTPYFMKGYVTGEKGKDVLDKNGWFHTGDVAYFDDDDFLYVVDRSKFTFKYYMHWVSPSEVEAIILKHPDVLSAVVIGMPDPLTTSAAKAFVVLKPGSKVSEEEIKVHVAERTEDHKHLHGGVLFVDGLPVTTGGKINRSALMQQALAESISRRE